MSLRTNSQIRRKSYDTYWNGKDRWDGKIKPRAIKALLVLLGEVELADQWPVCVEVETLSISAEHGAPMSRAQCRFCDEKINGADTGTAIVRMRVGVRFRYMNKGYAHLKCLQNFAGIEAKPQGHLSDMEYDDDEEDSGSDISEIAL